LNRRAKIAVKRPVRETWSVEDVSCCACMLNLLLDEVVRTREKYVPQSVIGFYSRLDTPSRRSAGIGSKAQQCLLIIFFRDLDRFVCTLSRLPQPNLSRSLDHVADMIFRRSAETDDEGIRTFVRVQADAFKWEFNGFSLCPEVISKNLERREPTLVLFTERFEKVAPFVTRNFSCTHMASGSLCLKICIAIGIVLASPDRNNDQPSVLRFDCLNLSASNR